MDGVIRPKVGNVIKEIAASDKNGESSAKIDTKHEYDKLSDYLAGNKDEFNEVEKSTIQRLLDKAKEYLKLNDSDDKKNVQENNTPSPENGSEVPNNGKDNVGEPDLNEQNIDPQPSEAEKTNNGKGNAGEPDFNEQNIDPQPSDTEKTNNGKDNSGEPASNEQNIEPRPADSTKENNNAPKKGEKVIIDGKVCIKMPNGALYDAVTGRKIKN